MKGLMAKLKGLKFKELLIGHGEKIVLGTVGLIVLVALYSTTWSGYENKPDDLLSKATAAGAKLNTGDLPKEKEDLFVASTYQATAVKMLEKKLNNIEAPNPYDFIEPMSFPLYPRQEPRGEPAFPVVQDLLADADVIVIGTNPPSIEGGDGVEAEGNEDDPLAAKVPTKGGLGAAPIGGPGADPALMGKMMGGGMPAGAGSTGVQPRGQRLVAVRGIVNLFDIGKEIQRACHLESLSEGIAAIEVIDFKIQRQKAVAGDNPWPDNTWQDVSLERADEILEESSGQAADLVDAGVTDPVFTMPLPSRLDGDYSESIVSHPRLKGFELTPEQRKIEQQLNAAFLDTAAELGVEDGATTSKRRGFLKNQIDINSVRNNVLEGGGKMEDIMKKAKITPGAGGAAGMPPMMQMMQGGGGMRSSAMGAMGSRMPAQAGGGGAPMPPMMMAQMGARGGKMPPMMGGGMGAGMGAGMGGQQGQPVGGSAVGYLMLFRFLDFDVNPGEAYRYRVKLEFTNPNYGLSLDKVKEGKVAEGESRLNNDWSEPTAPVVVKPDTNFYLAKVDKRARTRGEAEFEIFQWDPALGTIIDSKKLVTKYGQFVGGLEESDRLDLGAPSLENKTVLFATKDFLLDTALPPTLIPAENPDLNLTATGRQAKDGLELPAEAAVLDEYGQLRTLDSVSARAEVIAEEKKVKKEREPFESLRESAETETNSLDKAGSAEGGMPPMMQQMMQGLNSNLKRGGKDSAGKAKRSAGPGGYSPPGMPSPMGTSTKKKAGRGG